MSEREFDLAERAEALDLKLRRDDAGCYWLDYVGYVGCPDQRSVGPLDLDEIKDLVTAAERGMSTEQLAEYCQDQRWRRIHPELYEE